MTNFVFHSNRLFIIYLNLLVMIVLTAFITFMVAIAAVVSNMSIFK